MVCVVGVVCDVHVVGVVVFMLFCVCICVHVCVCFHRVCVYTMNVVLCVLFCAFVYSLCFCIVYTHWRNVTVTSDYTHLE